MKYFVIILLFLNPCDGFAQNNKAKIIASVDDNQSYVRARIKELTEIGIELSSKVNLTEAENAKLRAKLKRNKDLLDNYKNKYKLEEGLKISYQSKYDLVYEMLNNSQKELKKAQVRIDSLMADSTRKTNEIASLKTSNNDLKQQSESAVKNSRFYKSALNSLISNQSRITSITPYEKDRRGNFRILQKNTVNGELFEGSKQRYISVDGTLILSTIDEPKNQLGETELKGQLAIYVDNNLFEIVPATMYKEFSIDNKNGFIIYKFKKDNTLELSRDIPEKATLRAGFIVVEENTSSQQLASNFSSFSESEFTISTEKFNSKVVEAKISNGQKVILNTKLNSSEVRFTLRDNMSFDKDSVDIYINGEPYLEGIEITLTAKIYRFLPRKGENRLTIIARSQGSIETCTAEILIFQNDKQINKSTKENQGDLPTSLSLYKGQARTYYLDCN